MKLLLLLLVLSLVDRVLSVKHGLRATTERDRHLAADPYWSVFQSMNSGMVWPTPNSTVGNISSTFGPRIKSSCNCYDFHRGVDIHGNIGDRVVATYGGVVKIRTYYNDGGNTIVLEHTSPTSFVFQGRNLTKWYTHYMHLSAFINVTLNAAVAAGQLIGLVGDTGSTTNPHLHHEVRLGTRCSLEFARLTPTSTCNTYGFDPHVHPLMVYPTGMIGVSNISLSLTQAPNAQTAGKVRVVTSDVVPDVNQYLVQVISGGTARISHTLDLNLRTGYNASTTEALDTPDTSKPYLEPSSFGFTSSNWLIDLIIPPAWFITLNSSETVSVTVTNIWNGVTVISF